MNEWIFEFTRSMWGIRWVNKRPIYWTFLWGSCLLTPSLTPFSPFFSGFQAKALLRQPPWPDCAVPCRGHPTPRGTGRAPLCLPQLSWDDISGASGPGGHQHRVLWDQNKLMRTHPDLGPSWGNHSLLGDKERSGTSWWSLGGNI